MDAAGGEPSRPPSVRSARVCGESPEPMRGSAAPASARTDAIAKLRRAASQREVRRVSPRRMRLRQADAAPQVVQVQPPMLAEPLADPEGGHCSDSSEPRTTSWLTPSTSGDVPRAHSSDQLTTPHAEEASPLPSLDQLRRKILRDRKTSGLSRSASASATSRVARAYTMQKLMGATTPVPYNNMFAFVRSVNEARSSEFGDGSPSADVSLESESEKEAPADPDESTPPRDSKRATLMRSVSAREVARMHMFQKLVNKRERAGERAGDARKARAPSPPPDVPAPPPSETPRTLASGTPPPGAAQDPLLCGAPAPMTRHTPPHLAAGGGHRGEPPSLTDVPIVPSAVPVAGSAAPAPSDATAAPALPTAPASPTRPPAATVPATAPLPSTAVLPTVSSPMASVVPGKASASPSAPSASHAGTERAHHSAFSDSSASTYTDSDAARASRGTPNNSSEMLSMLQGLSTQLDAEAREARARRMRGKGPGYLARAVSAGSAAAPGARPGTEVLDALGKPEPASGAARTETLPSRGAAVGLGIDASVLPTIDVSSEAVSPSAAASEWPHAAPPVQEKPLPGLPNPGVGMQPLPGRLQLAPSALPMPSPESPAMGAWHVHFLDGVARPVYDTAMHPRPSLERLSRTPRPSWESLERRGGRSPPLDTPRGSPEVLRAPAPQEPVPEKKEGRGARFLGSLRRKTSRVRLAERMPPPRVRTEPPARALLCFQDDAAAAGLHRVVVPLTALQIARLSREGGLSTHAVLSRFPAELPLGEALEPPRQLLHVAPVLQTAGEAYVKLRYLYIFSDVAVLVKPMHVPTHPEELSAYMLQRLHAPADLREGCVPLSVLALRRTRLVPSALARSAEDEGVRMVALRHRAALETRLPTALPAVLGELEHAPDAAGQARLLYLLPELDRRVVSEYLYVPEHRAVLEAYVAQYHFSGVSLEAALRMLFVDLRFPTHASVFELLLLIFAAHWLRSNRHELSPAFTLELTTDLTLALLALNDALHGDTHETPGAFARPNPALTLEQFVRNVREQDPHHLLSDRELREFYLGIKTCALAQASNAPPRRIVFYAAALADGLVAGVPSAPVTIALDAPDPDVRIKLMGRDLYFDPPVLSFAHASAAEFTVCSTAPGDHQLVFVRLGAHAPLYPPTAETRGTWQALPRSLPLTSEAHAARPALTLQHMPASGIPSVVQFYLADADAVHSVARLLQERFAHTMYRGPAGDAVHTLVERIAHLALLGEEARAPATTGRDLCRVVRENSLLFRVLGASGDW